MSTLKVNTLEEATAGGATFATIKAWMTYNQRTPTIEDSFAVSSVSDNSTGNFTVNLTNTFSNTGYCIICTGDLDPGGFTAAAVVGVGGSKVTSSVQMLTDNISDQRQDRRVNCQFLGTLA